MAIAHVNDTDLFYTTVGRGPLPCLVMHGGLGVDHTYLHPWLDPLGDIATIVYYDHRGNGRSGRPPLATLTLDQFASDADALRSHLGLGTVAVFGHSVGGFIALTYALAYPRSVSHLILADTAASFDYVDEVVANARKRGASKEILDILEAPNPSDDEGLKAMMKAIMPLYFHSFDQSLADRLMANTIVSAYASTANDIFMPSYNLKPRLGEIHIPTLILVGGDDFICPPNKADIMHQAISGSQMRVFERSGHHPQAEEPDQFIRAIKTWLAHLAS